MNCDVFWHFQVVFCWLAQRPKSVLELEPFVFFLNILPFLDFLINFRSDVVLLEIIPLENAFCDVLFLFMHQIFDKVAQNGLKTAEHVLNLPNWQIIVVVELFVDIPAQIIPHGLLQQALLDVGVVVDLEAVSYDEFGCLFAVFIGRQGLNQVFLVLFRVVG